MFVSDYSNSILFRAACAVVALLLLLFFSSCNYKVEEEIVIEQLTPEEVLEYIEIFKLDCDLSDEDIVAGQDYILTATEETEDFLFRLNFFTGAFHAIGENGALDLLSDEFREAYLQGVEAKRKYTGHLTAHWNWPDPFLDVRHVEAYPAELYYFYKNLPEEIVYRTAIDKDGLTLPQYLDYISHYNLDWSGGPRREYDGSGTLSESEWRTTSGLDYAEYYYERLMDSEERKAIAAEYGITESAPMDFSWVLDHPKEALEIIIRSGLCKEYEVFYVFDRTIPELYLEKQEIPFFPPNEEPES